jgi:uncharacterized protein YoxC
MDMQHLDTILIVMVAIFGLSVLLHILVLAGVAISSARALKAAKQYGEEMRAKVEPVLHSSHELLEQTKALMARLEPKLESAAGDLAEITRTTREETVRISASTEEITGRIRRQAERMDEMTTSALNGVDKVGHFVNQVVNAPARQVSGVLAAARAIVNTLRSPAPPRTPPDPEERNRDERQQYV